MRNFGKTRFNLQTSKTIDPTGITLKDAPCACNHDHCYLYRHGSVGILLIKLTGLAHTVGEISGETIRWLRTTLDLDNSRCVLNAGYPSIVALLVLTDKPLSSQISSEKALSAILETWQGQVPGRVYRVVAPAICKTAAALASQSSHHTLVPQNKDGVAYALVRCVAHPDRASIYSRIVPPRRRTCFARILLGPILGEVTARTMSVLVELTASANVILSMRPALGPHAASEERRVYHTAMAHTPLVININGLTPNFLYAYAININEPNRCLQDREIYCGDLNRMAYDSQRGAIFRTPPVKPSLYKLAAVRGALFDPRRLEAMADVGRRNFFRANRMQHNAPSPRKLPGLYEHI
mmetsp:Transcript_35124/g.107797  ORF Transcript_35124/g.107797 Transcript_35124/m.107797 type:complete len:353 (-) Transcript_35124:3565-4623(-)